MEREPPVVARDIASLSHSRISPLPKPNEGIERELDRRQAFRVAAETLGATFLPGKRTSQDEVHLKHGPWQLTLDTYTQSNGQTSVTYTRARAFYVAKEDFTFRVSRRNIFTRIVEMFGFYGLLVGDQELERKYTIKSSSAPRGRSLLTDRKLRELIMVQPSLRLEIRRLSWAKRRKRGEGVRTVTVRTTGVIKEPERLANYMRLVANALEQLVRIGAAHELPAAEDRVYALPRHI